MVKLTSKQAKNMLRILRRTRNLHIFHTDVDEYLAALEMVFGSDTGGCVLCGKPTKASQGHVIDLDSFFCGRHCPVCELNEPTSENNGASTHVEVSPPLRPVAILGPDGRDSGRTVFTSELRSDGEWPR